MYGTVYKIYMKNLSLDVKQQTAKLKVNVSQKNYQIISLNVNKGNTCQVYMYTPRSMCGPNTENLDCIVMGKLT